MPVELSVLSLPGHLNSAKVFLKEKSGDHQNEKVSLSGRAEVLELN